MDIFYPVELFADWFTFSLLRLSHESHLGESVRFFVYDSIKISLLLFVIMFFVALVRSFLPPEKVKNFLSNRFEILSNILASMVGTLTPFCTCSAITLFIGLLESGVPLGVTFSYLIAAPMVNEVGFVLLLGYFGWRIALIYWFTGVILAISVGYLLGKMKLESQVQDYVWQINRSQDISLESLEKITWKKRISDAYQSTKELFKKIFLFIVLGILIGSLIHGYVPQDFLLKVANKNNPFAVFIVVLLGVPMYANAAGTVPIITALIQKGLPLGTALALMMSITALSLPEMIILKQVLKTKLLVLYFSIVTLGILIIGYLFNWLI